MQSKYPLKKMKQGIKKYKKVITRNQILTLGILN